MNKQKGKKSKTPLKTTEKKEIKIVGKGKPKLLSKVVVTSPALTGDNVFLNLYTLLVDQHTLLTKLMAIVTDQILKQRGNLSYILKS